MRTRRCRVKPIGEILRFVGHQSFAEFHDAHRVRWYAVIGKYEFSDPEIAAADNSPDRKTLLVWLDEPALLNVVPAADPLARLRIIKHSILAVDFMFDLEIARVRSIPMALQRHPHGSIIHLNLPPALPAVPAFQTLAPGTWNGRGPAGMVVAANKVWRTEHARSSTRHGARDGGRIPNFARRSRHSGACASTASRPSSINAWSTRATVSASSASSHPHA